jgi:serine/threonine-protein kinase
VARVQIALPAEASLLLDRQPSLALAPDGTRLAFVAARGSHAQILMRRLDKEAASPVPGTEGGTSPFFSPDGEWLGFLAEGKLKKVPAAGGQAQALVEAPALHGASWGDDGSILLAPSSTGGLVMVPAGGGKARAVTSPDSRTGESSHRWPELLPGARAALFVVHGPGSEEPRIAIIDLRTGERRMLIEDGTFPRYLPTGHVVFSRGEALMAAPFDLRRLELAGPPTAAVQGVTVSPMSGAAHFAVARDGSLAYVPGGVLGARSLLWVDRQGAARPVTEEQRAYVSPDLSADGQRVAVAVEGDQGLDIWTHDLTRGSLTRLTSDAGNEVAPVWAADGRAVAYGSPLESPSPGLLSMSADGAGQVRRLFAGGRRHVPGSWSPDGRFLAFTDQDPTPGSTGNDILVLSREDDGRVRPFLNTQFDEAGPMFSPTGRFLAFTSNETGRDEVYVRPFPGPGGKWQISTEGGSEPRWSPVGDELFFRSGGRMMTASVSTSPRFRAGRPVLLFEGPYDPGTPARPNYAVSRDGQRFLMIRSVQPPAPTRLNLVLGWPAELPARSR